MAGKVAGIVDSLQATEHSIAAAQVGLMPVSVCVLKLEPHEALYSSWWLV